MDGIASVSNRSLFGFCPHAVELNERADADADGLLNEAFFALNGISTNWFWGGEEEGNQINSLSGWSEKGGEQETIPHSTDISDPIILHLQICANNCSRIETLGLEADLKAI